MTITATEFMNSGLGVSTDITDPEIEMAIKTVEQFYVKPVFGDETWSNICQHPASYAEMISGTDTLAGLKAAEYHLVFAYMLYDNVRLTRYASVIKNDEHSNEPSREDLLKAAAYHWEIGSTFVLECSKFIGIEKPKQLNNLIFNELLG